MRGLSFLNRLALSLSVTLLFLVLFFQFDEPSRYRDFLAAGDLKWILSASLLVPLIAIIRAWRLAIVMKIPLTPGLTRISILHNFMVAIAPMRSGELALPYLLRRYGNGGLVEGVAVLMAIRIYDLLAVLFIGGIAAGFADLPSKHGPILCIGAITVSAVAVVSGALLPWLARRVILLRFGFLAKHPRILDGFKRLFQTLGKCSFDKILIIALSSITIWSLLLFIFLFTARAYGLSLDLAVSFFAGCGAFLASFFPISGLANFGPLQAAWGGILAWIGLPWEVALYSGLVAHMITIIGISILALIVYLLIPFRLHSAERDIVD